MHHHHVADRTGSVGEWRPSSALTAFVQNNADVLLYMLIVLGIAGVIAWYLQERADLNESARLRRPAEYEQEAAEYQARVDADRGELAPLLTGETLTARSKARVDLLRRRIALNLSLADQARMNAKKAMSR